jgi:ornithine cyclodeaminase/alanine dehydrogenase-like protein (mu-crystallin family)
MAAMASRTDRASIPALRWFGAADVMAAMPDIDERLRLAELTMTALARPGASELPPKIAIHPRPDASFVHAMPAHLRGPDAGSDLVGMKWVAGYATNTDLGLPGIHAVVVLNDPATGLPTAMLDGGPITAQRTAAVSGLAISRWGPRGGERGGAPVAVALIGAGVQGHSHLPVIGHVLPGAHLRLFDRDQARAEALGRTARSTPGIGAVTVHDTARAAVEMADVVISAASFGPPGERQAMTNAWLRPDATIVPIDYATYCAAEVARDAALFLVDQREQYLANRDAGQFDGYPDPVATIGEALIAGTDRPEGRVVITHLGVGLADLVFADAIVRAAEARGLGVELPR